MYNVILNLNKITVVGFFGLSVLYSANLKAQSLEAAVATALDTHPDIRQAFARFKAKEEDVNRASAGYLPTIDLTAGYGYEYTDTPGNRRNAINGDDGETELARGEFGVSIKQILFDGMFTSNEIDRTKFEASAEQWTLIANAEDLALQVAKAYLNFIKTAEFVKLSEKNIASHQAIYLQIKERTDSGLGNIADLSQVTGRLARAQSNMISARNNNLDARSQFIRLTNAQPNSLVLPVPDADMLPKDKVLGLNLAIKNHPVIRSAQQDISAARSFKSSINARYYPTLSLELAANSDNDIAGESGINRFGPDVGGHRNDATAMLRFRYNFYAGGKDVASERSAAYKVSEAQEINYSAHRQVTESFGLAWNAFKMLALQKKYLKQHVTTSSDTKSAYKQQFDIGQRNLLDLLDTENELFQARKDYLDADFNELSAQYRLLNATGQLLDSLRVTRSTKWKGEHEYEQGAYNE
ncbi:TolC family outer membrane protein [Colwellia hornerae]|uniref:TolC family outer membrane protein n=1 Tax=Colwellia hornerae TaxID=89402 RepID=A0A5C6Q7R0_9GAMM|nr:TolC family outer membrane protein [Colwellia hornerae]TWX52198.1 TolC family outer membrane protein [Colwellia hornerae]TWX57547.1 TolC family outer membrane protein [Colwellia hornerae]TWX64899.1 TolC family outer membrane protein [Colwellia hornerae]